MTPELAIAIAIYCLITYFIGGVIRRLDELRGGDEGWFQGYWYALSPVIVPAWLFIAAVWCVVLWLVFGRRR